MGYGGESSSFMPIQHLRVFCILSDALGIGIRRDEELLEDFEG